MLDPTRPYSDVHGLMHRAIAKFEKNWPRMSAVGKGSFTLPVDPENSKRGRVRVVYDNGRGASQARDGGKLGNYTVDLGPVFSEEAARQVLAHEITHVAQKVRGTFGRDHHRRLRELQMAWESEHGRQYDDVFFYRQIAHGDMPTEWEAETMALIEGLRVDATAVPEFIVTSGPYFRYEWDIFHRMATAHGVHEGQLERFKHTVAALFSGFVQRLETGAALPVASCLALRQLATPMTLVGLDPTDGLDIALQAFRGGPLGNGWPQNQDDWPDKFAREVTFVKEHGHLPPFWYGDFNARHVRYPIEDVLASQQQDAAPGMPGGIGP